VGFRMPYVPLFAAVVSGVFGVRNLLGHRASAAAAVAWRGVLRVLRIG